MTNQQIIAMETAALAEDGTLKYTGRVFQMQTPDGETIEVKEIEPVHTFQGWKARGRVVKKGEHARCSFPIWKHKKARRYTDKKTGEEKEAREKMIMVKAYFFTADQTQPA